MKLFLSVVAILPTIILIIVAIAQTQPKPIEPVKPLPERWRKYDVGTAEIYEWRDQWGRVCTMVRIGGQGATLDCEYPQRGTP